MGRGRGKENNGSIESKIHPTTLCLSRKMTQGDSLKSVENWGGGQEKESNI
jgi:hypothetical protein